MALAHRAKNTYAALPFISTWRTSITYSGSTANNQIKLPLEVGGTYKFTVDWGDTTSSVITTWNQAETTHTYPAPGDYTVTITGFIKGWDFGRGGGVAPTTGDMRKLLTITQWGCLRFVTHLDPVPLQIWGAFYGCTNLTLTTVTDTPNFKGTISTHGFLRGCNAVTTINNINKWDVSKIQIFRSMLREMALFDDNVGNWNTASATNFLAMFTGGGVSILSKFNNGGSPSIGNWNTSNVTSITSIFQYQPYFNQNIGNWNTSKVANMNSMFYGCNIAPYGLFNNGGSNSINNWDTGEVTTMVSMFAFQPNFNQSIGNWDTSKVTTMEAMFWATPFNEVGGIFNQDISNWNTSNVSTTRTMFYRQYNFNQDINTKTVTVNDNTYTAWDTSKVTNMQLMFAVATGFNQDISNWDISSVTNFTSFMYLKNSSNFSAANYDALLIAWASRPVKPNINIDFAAIKRTTASDAAKTILTSAPNNWTIADGGLI